MAIDQTLLERTNPVFDTAKMTLFNLAEAGDPDAAAIVGKLGLTEEQTQDSATTVATPEQIVANAFCMEVRYATANKIAEETPCSAYVDLPCGYTPRAIQFSRKGLRYIGMDLPATIAEMEPLIASMIGPEQQRLVKFAGVDATNYPSLEQALEGVEGPVCILTEGLLMYFTDSEAGVFCDNIRRILEKHGGVWIMADPEGVPRRLSIIHILFGEQFTAIEDKAKQRAMEKSDVVMENNPLILKAEDASNGREAAMDFLSKHGLKAERLILYDHLPTLKSLSLVSPGQADAVREALKKCAFWKAALAENGIKPEADASKAFNMTTAISVRTLKIDLAGRLDTITAPELLDFYEKHRDEIRAAHVDCARLDYISSAGLRVLLIMQKGCPGGVTLSGVNSAVKEILEQTGFTKAFTVS